MLRLTRLLKDLRDQRGVTLVELVVVISILGVVLTFVTQGLISMQNATVGQSYRLQNLDEARILMDTVSRDIRTATRLSATSSPFSVTAGSVPAPGFGHAAPYAGDTEVWFYSNLTLSSSNPNPCPDVVHLYVDTSVNPPVLKEQNLSDANAGDAPPTCTYPSTASSYNTRLVGKYVANPSNEPVFTYYYPDATTGAPTAFPQTSTQTATGLQASDMLLVNEVGLTLAIREANNYHAPYTTLVNRVSMPNIDYNPLPSPS
jgi:prepilin-type N-terminal cleavage/methylation domain-containing protein